MALQWAQALASLSPAHGLAAASVLAPSSVTPARLDSSGHRACPLPLLLQRPRNTNTANPILLQQREWLSKSSSSLTGLCLLAQLWSWGPWDAVSPPGSEGHNPACTELPKPTSPCFQHSSREVGDMEQGECTMEGPWKDRAEQAGPGVRGRAPGDAGGLRCLSASHWVHVRMCACARTLVSSQLC